MSGKIEDRESRVLTSAGDCNAVGRGLVREKPQPVRGTPVVK